jgi:hypothetical protein
MKITEQLFTTNIGILSSPTDLQGLSLLMDLQTVASEIGKGIRTQGISMLSESIRNCTGLDYVCNIDLKLRRTRLMFSEITYVRG